MSLLSLVQRRLSIVMILIAGGILAQVLRTSTAAIAPDLMRDIGFSPDALGVLTGVFFLAQALMQIPVGILIDRFGGRLTISGLYTIAVVGALIFAVAETFSGLTLARVLMAIGISGAIIGAFVVLESWFSSEKLPQMAALQISAGQIGVLLATAPLAFASELFGWRNVFFGLSIITAVMVLSIFSTLRDAPPGQPASTSKHESLKENLNGVLAVFRNRYAPFFFVMVFVANPLVVCVLTLLGGPFLFDTYQLGAVERGHVLFGMGVTAMLSPLLFGQLQRWFSIRQLVRGGAVYAAAICLGLALMPSAPLWLTSLLMIMLGFSGGYAVLIFTDGRRYFPAHLAGRSMTALNMAQMSGMAAIQFVAGFFLSFFPVTTSGHPSPLAYRATFVLLAMIVLSAYLVYRRIPPLTTRPG